LDLPVEQTVKGGTGTDRRVGLHGADLRKGGGLSLLQEKRKTNNAQAHWIGS